MEKAVAYVFIKLIGARVRRLIRRLPNDAADEDYIGYEPKPAMVERMGKRGYAFCNWHFVTVKQRKKK